VLLVDEPELLGAVGVDGGDAGVVAGAGVDDSLFEPDALLSFELAAGLVEESWSDTEGAVVAVVVARLSVL